MVQNGGGKIVCKYRHFCGEYKEISVYCSYLSRYCQTHKAFDAEEILARERVERLKARNPMSMDAQRRGKGLDTFADTPDREGESI
jgi:hypothetical protein